MPVHDWTRVEDGVFHDFHVGWVPLIRTALNDGLLPEGYYAMAEQHFGRPIADVLTLHASPPPLAPQPLPPATGGLALAEAPPKVRGRRTIQPAARARRRSLVIRHVSGHRLVARVEIVSPANKDRAKHVEEFAAKVVSALGTVLQMALAYSSSDPSSPKKRFLQRGYRSNNAMSLRHGSGSASSRSSLTRLTKTGAVGLGKTIRASSTASCGDCTPARLGVTSPNAMALGKPSTVASGAGAR